MGNEAWAGEPGEAMKREIPLRRFAMPEEVAAATLFLASDGAGMITGANLIVDGGYTIPLSQRQELVLVPRPRSRSRFVGTREDGGQGRFYQALDRSLYAGYA
jgi:Enoyl-(Acyl carrier protein) reductase